MKKNLRLFICGFLMLAGIAKSNAQSTLIHYWHFNNDTTTQYTPNIMGIHADYSFIDTAKAKILYAEIPGTSAAYHSYVDTVQPLVTDYDTLNAQQGQPAGVGIRFRNPSDSLQLLFYIPTTNFHNIALAYAAQSSSTSHGQLHQLYSYSVDSGATWRTSGLSMPSFDAPLTYGLATVSFTDTQVNNNPRMVFRIIFSGNDTGTKGNNRFDNVTVKGDSLHYTAVAPLALVAPHYSIFPNPVRNQLTIDASADGKKTIIIINNAGQVVYTATESGKAVKVNTTGLIPGSYIVSIRDWETATIANLQFTK